MIDRQVISATKNTNPHKAILLPENSLLAGLGKRLKLNIVLS
jgi:hypothetical protein